MLLDWIRLDLSEPYDQFNLPPASAFTVTADGNPLTVTGLLTSLPTRFRIVVSPLVRHGQTVTVSYSDPTPGDDAEALQDLAGNDLASFENRPIRNNSTLGSQGPDSPEITGTARVGETLTASSRTIRDAQGVATAVYGYQWIRVDGSGEADIPGAAAQTYTLTDVDQGNRIRVRASFVDDAGNPETRTSDRTGTVAVSATAPKITIAPDRAKATGRFDFIRYTVAREGPATDALTVTVRLEAPAGNDWEIDDDKRSHEVAFRAGEAEKTLLISLRRVGPANVGFSHAAAQGGTLLARLDGTTGYDTADTAEVEVVVVPNPLWIARLTEPAYTFIEDGTTYEVEIEVAAASPDMPAPSMPPDGNNPVEVYIATSSDTAFADVDYEAFGRSLPIPLSSFMAGPDGVQRGRAVFRFAALQDSEPEGAETLWFYLERSPIVAIGLITFEGPDGRRDTNSVRYPATIVDANTPASGAPAIAGTGRAGETLRATTDAVSDVDGLGEFTYRWVRVDGASRPKSAPAPPPTCRSRTTSASGSGWRSPSPTRSASPRGRSRAIRWRSARRRRPRSAPSSTLRAPAGPRSRPSAWGWARYRCSRCRWRTGTTPATRCSPPQARSAAARSRSAGPPTRSKAPGRAPAGRWCSTSTAR